MNDLENKTMTKIHYQNQSKVYIKELREGKIEVKNNILYINADFIDFGNKKWQDYCRKIDKIKLEQNNN